MVHHKEEITAENVFEFLSVSSSRKERHSQKLYRKNEKRQNMKNWNSTGSLPIEHTQRKTKATGAFNQNCNVDADLLANLLSKITDLQQDAQNSTQATKNSASKNMIQG